ncbi:MAG: anthranilate phosphoribosyltransferase [Desulfatiglans sp.]|nr:anthranilate phosphoribosyltransferase [Desulfatiglans sp.]
MAYNENSLKRFGDNIAMLMAGNNISKETAKEMMIETLKGDQPDLQQGAFLAALRMKGETDDEIVGCFEAIIESDTNSISLGDLPVVENCGTGMDTLKTFNISTISAIVASSLDVPIARHGARAISSKCGTVDLCETLGVDVDCSVEKVKESIERCGLGLFNGTSAEVHPMGLGRILSQIRFGTTLNIAASLANPALPRIAVRGVGAPEQIEPTLKVMQRIGYEKGIVFHGFNNDMSAGMDELSTLGISRIGHFNKNEVEYFEITPEAAGLSNGDYNDIRPETDKEIEAAKAVSLLAGKGDKSRSDIVALNAGAVLWMADSVNSLKEGVSAAKQIISKGSAIQKLLTWVRAQNREPESGYEIIKRLCNRCNIEMRSIQ